MKFAAIGLVVLVTSTFMLSPAHADGTGQVNFFVGQKSLDDDDWMPVEDQPEFGAVMSFGQVDWPVHIAVDVLGSATEEDIFLGGNVTVTGMTFEIDAGVRKIWGKKVLPYIGAGVAVIGAAVEFDDGFTTVDANETGFGFWADAGVFFRLGSHFNIGIDVRYSDADVDLDFGQNIVAQDLNAGGLHYGVLLGFGW